MKRMRRNFGLLGATAAVFAFNAVPALAAPQSAAAASPISARMLLAVIGIPVLAVAALVALFIWRQSALQKLLKIAETAAGAEAEAAAEPETAAAEAEIAGIAETADSEAAK